MDASMLFSPSGGNRVIPPFADHTQQQRQDSRDEARSPDGWTTTTPSLQVASVTPRRRLSNKQQQQQQTRKKPEYPRVLVDLKPIARVHQRGATATNNAAISEQKTPRPSHRAMNQQQQAIEKLKGRKQQQLEALEDEARIYGGASQALPATTTKLRSMAKTKRGPLDPLIRRIEREKLSNERQASTLARALEVKVDRMGVNIPVSFLLERQHVAFTERVVLTAMCKVLTRHYRRVVHTSFALWKRQTLTHRVLEDHARHVLLLKQTSLAYACAIIQRKQQIRMRKFLSHWRQVTLEIRIAEHNHFAQVIQRYWRKYSLLVRFKWLAQAYRVHIRHENATIIQSAVRRFLATRQFQRFVADHRRSLAAQYIQRCYCNYQIRKIAHRQRQRDAVLFIQRCWRGHKGRRRVVLRRQQIRLAAEAVYNSVWRPRAVERVEFVWRQVVKIQHCVRAFWCRCRVASAMRRNRRHRLYLPAFRIQRAWSRYRENQIVATISNIVDSIVETSEYAATRIQTTFKRFIKRKRSKSAFILTKLFRCFSPRKVVIRRQLAWLQQWTDHFFKRWRSDWFLNSDKWHEEFTTIQRNLQEIIGNQHSATKRLNTLAGCRLIVQIKKFHQSFQESNARTIQNHWRWHRFRVVMHNKMQAVHQLQRLLPQLFRSFKQRRRRRQMLGRWKRQRFVEMKTVFQQWRAFRMLAMEAKALKVMNELLRRVKWFRHQKLRKRMMNGWKSFIERRHECARKRKRADELAALHLKQRVWRFWTKEKLPELTFEEPDERAESAAVYLAAVDTLLCPPEEDKASDSMATKKASTALHRCLEARPGGHEERYDASATSQRPAGCEKDVLGFHKTREVPETRFVFIYGFDSFSFVSWFLTTCVSCVVVVVLAVDQLCRKLRTARGVRQWALHMSFTHQKKTWDHQSLTFYNQHTQQKCWDQWTRYVRHRRGHRLQMAKVDAFRDRKRLQGGISRWGERVPILRDLRFTTSLANQFYNLKLTQYVFQRGLFEFWAITVGARRVQMATRIQRKFRSKRARKKLFVLRTKLKYQLEARVTKGLDAVEFNPETLIDSLKDTQKNVWIFALLAYPWQPVSSELKDIFNTVATNWRYLRKKRMAFGAISATENVPSSMVDDGEAGGDDTNHTKYSLLSWLEIEPHFLPCIVAFWQGRSTLTGETLSASRMNDGRRVKRRFASVCGESAKPSLTFQLTRSSPKTSSHGVSVLTVMEWIDALQRASHEATAIDLQAYFRAVLACRIAKTYREARRHDMARRLQNWFRNLQIKWRTRKQNRAALKLQRWYHGIVKRRLFWRNFQAAMALYRSAATAIQRFSKRFFARKRFKLLCQCLVITADRLPNAPLCEECFGVSSQEEAGAPEHQDERKFVLATLKCRDCTQALCATCFAKLHRSGKRMLHLADRIEVQAMNDPEASMCDVCEVAVSRKYCATCSQSSQGSSHTTATIGRSRGFCTSCFELAHSEPGATGDGSSASRKHRLKSWWASERFKSHEWSRAAAAGDRPTARDIVIKCQWRTLAAFRAQQGERLQAKHTQKEREGELFAIRMQHEATLRDAFDRYDSDRSGFIDKTELKQMFKEELCQPLRDDQIDDAMRAMDKSGDGKVQFDELLQWFAEGVLDNSTQVASSASDLLKDALRAKRKMRRYKEKLNGLLLPVGSTIKDKLNGVLSPISGSGEAAGPPPIPKVPGFPSVDCLEPRDYAHKRKVFYRFLKEICQIEWIEEDEAIIPIENASDVFATVFLPRWNAGELTFDFYFDDETFVFEGSEWQRRWDSQSNTYLFHTRRKKQKTVGLENGEANGSSKRRKSSRGSGRRKSSKRRTQGRRQDEGDSADGAKGNGEDGEFEDVIEVIDPRRKQLLFEDAKRAFATADQDASGYIDAKEFHHMLVAELCEPISRSKAREIMNQIDADKSGKIDFDEFSLCVVSGLKVKQALEDKLRANQLARDCKGASAELVTLLYEGFPKLLASKALTLHQQNVDLARVWLAEKQQEEQQEKDLEVQECTDRKLMKKRAAQEAEAKRKKRVASVKKMMKLLFFNPNKKEVHAAKMHDALQNLNREIMLVDQQLSSKLLASGSKRKGP